MKDGLGVSTYSREPWLSLRCCMNHQDLVGEAGLGRGEEWAASFP